MNKRLFVGGIPFSSSREELVSLFSQFGKITSASIIFDRFTNKSKGFGFVEMETENEAKEAVNNLNGYEFNGRKLTVVEARPIESKKFGSRSFGKTKQYFSGQKSGKRTFGRGDAGRFRDKFQRRGGR